jgi:hypothetical protein
MFEVERSCLGRDPLLVRIASLTSARMSRVYPTISSFAPLKTKERECRRRVLAQHEKDTAVGFHPRLQGMIYFLLRDFRIGCTRIHTKTIYLYRAATIPLPIFLPTSASSLHTLYPRYPLYKSNIPSSRLEAIYMNALPGSKNGNASYLYLYLQFLKLDIGSKTKS